MTPTPAPSAAALPVPDTWARLLGAAGLIPFIGLALMLAWLAPAQQRVASTALLGYAALIASFLGGIHWGLVMKGAPQHRLHLVWGVTPSLLAWVCLLLPPAAGLAACALTLALCLAVDWRLWPALGLQGWLGLRTVLTATAGASCLVGAAILLR